jgi:hypothetical protein
MASPVGVELRLDPGQERRIDLVGLHFLGQLKPGRLVAGGAQHIGQHIPHAAGGAQDAHRIHLQRLGQASPQKARRETALAEHIAGLLVGPARAAGTRPRKVIRVVGIWKFLGKGMT